MTNDSTPIPTLHILIIEDENKMIESWVRVFTRHNEDKTNKGFDIKYEIAQTLAEGEELLEARRFDAVIVDLGLRGEGEASEINSEGNKIVRLIVSTQPIGVIIYTGQTEDAEDFSKSFVRVIDKSEGQHKVLEWLTENKEVFIGIRETEAAFRSETAKVFFSQIWQRWKFWTEGAKSSGTDISKSVARHIMAHVHDVLLSADEDKTHPEEAYFVPPLKLRLDTGDLVTIEGKKWIVVSPRCDLANPTKVETILLAHCVEFAETWEKTKPKDLNKVIQHEGSPKQHFLFPLRDNEGSAHGPWMVQFHNIKALPTQEAIDSLPKLRFASLSPLFVPSLVERFGSYFSRIGTPGSSS
ncbi:MULTISPECIES: histidine kinase [Pseudomonas syringae group]|uniref:histidine kinase n=1 Tax=Pseudomonas syringae group TaxID=136849 RepID=UPI000F01D219|nr:histidine kinase [Pseudomonas viridiflava]MCF8980293.1 histidine kinase [Pseudomonas syringae]MEE4159510.1 histidine kinase [Pseudomonas viridiflava]